MSLVNIKSEIKTLLDELVTAGTLGAVESADLKKDPLNSDIGAYPFGMLMPPSIESAIEDNRSVIRTYTFEMLFFINVEDITGASDVEAIMEAVLNKFDNNPTLNGKATAGISPVTSSPEPIQHNSKDLILFSVILKASECVSLTFA